MGAARLWWSIRLRRAAGCCNVLTRMLLAMPSKLQSSPAATDINSRRCCCVPMVSLRNVFGLLKSGCVWGPEQQPSKDLSHLFSPSALPPPLRKAVIILQLWTGVMRFHHSMEIGHFRARVVSPFRYGSILHQTSDGCASSVKSCTSGLR